MNVWMQIDKQIHSYNQTDSIQSSNLAPTIDSSWWGTKLQK